MIRAMLLVTAVLIAACAQQSDTASSIESDSICDPAEPPSVELGNATGGDFEPLQDGDPSFLVGAPQGGFGVAIRAMTTGLLTDDYVDVNLITEVDGSTTGEFLNEGVNLYCHESGRGLIWGAVVGFDPELFPSTESLGVLYGKYVKLTVEVSDATENTAVGTVSVLIRHPSGFGDEPPEISN